MLGRLVFASCVGLVAAACGYSSLSSPTQAAPTPTPPAPTPTPTPAPVPSPSPSPASAAQFVVVPSPVDHVISIPPGGTVHVHAGYQDPAGGNPVLFAEWGDGTRDRIYCGPCRLQHVYPSAGSFRLVATVVGASATFSHPWTVSVQ